MLNYVHVEGIVARNWPYEGARFLPRGHLSRPWSHSQTARGQQRGAGVHDAALRAPELAGCRSPEGR